MLSEKDERGTVGAGEEEAQMEGGEDLWGHEEAMAPDEELSPAEELDSDPGIRGTILAWGGSYRSAVAYLFMSRVKIKFRTG